MDETRLGRRDGQLRAAQRIFPQGFVSTCTREASREPDRQRFKESRGEEQRRDANELTTMSFSTTSAERPLNFSVGSLYVHCAQHCGSDDAPRPASTLNHVCGQHAQSFRSEISSYQLEVTYPSHVAPMAETSSITEDSLKSALAERLKATHVEVTDMSGTYSAITGPAAIALAP